MKDLTPAQWKTLRLSGRVTTDEDVVEWETVRFDGIHHVVHDYANFVSSAEMVTTGKHLGKGLSAPVNTHLFHAFLLNCRKIADFFDKRSKEDDVIADDYVPGFTVKLPNCALWRDPVNKQLTHITYTRWAKPKEITTQANIDMYNEFKKAWKDFQRGLLNPFAKKFEQEITNKLLELGFRDLDLW